MTQIQGVRIDSGASDFQIFQRGPDGAADITVRGRWGCEKPCGAIEIRLVREDTGTPVTAKLDWTRVEVNAEGTWSGTLKQVPAGGLYRLETHLLPEGESAQEWARRGDMRHFLGVGDLWVIAGQSNSAGYGRGPSYDPPELGLHLFTNAMRWAIATQPMNESTDSAHPVNSETANSGHSPWLHWARLVKQAVGVPIGLIQTSLGGSPLSRWNPTEAGDHGLYETMIQCVRQAGGKVRGVLWYQGCSDTTAKEAPTYEARFLSAVRAWREALESPDLFVLTVQLNRVCDVQGPDRDVAWSMVREAQRQAPAKLEGVCVVPTLDLPLSDFIHLSPAGNMLLADRAAQAVLAGVYGHDLATRAPEPRSAVRSPDGTAIDLVFDHVTSRLGAVDSTGIPFRVEDTAGVVPVVKVSHPGGAAVKLELQRPIQGAAWISAAFGPHPPAVPFDMIRFMPILAFHRFPVA